VLQERFDVPDTSCWHFKEKGGEEKGNERVASPINKQIRKEACYGKGTKG